MAKKGTRPQGNIMPPRSKERLQAVEIKVEGTTVFLHRGTHAVEITPQGIRVRKRKAKTWCSIVRFEDLMHMAKFFGGKK